MIESTLCNSNLVTDEELKEFIAVRGKGWVCEVNNEIVGFSIADFKDNNIRVLVLIPEFKKRNRKTTSRYYA